MDEDSDDKANTGSRPRNNNSRRRDKTKNNNIGNKGSKQQADVDQNDVSKSLRNQRAQPAKARNKNHNKSTPRSKNPLSDRKNNAKSKRSPKNDNFVYPRYAKLDQVLNRYNQKDPNLIRGTIRVLPGKDSMAFLTCDRGSLKQDVVLEGPQEQNRALHGDSVFVELLPLEGKDDEGSMDKRTEISENSSKQQQQHKETRGSEQKATESWWQDDEVQMGLWSPVVPIQRKKGISQEVTYSDDRNSQQRKGRVVYVISPKAMASEITPTEETKVPFRRIVGSVKRLHDGTTLLTSANKSLPQFRLSNSDAEKSNKSVDDAMFQAHYVYGSWHETFKWPPCTNVQQFGRACNVEDETLALLIDNQVDHGEFPASVLEECAQVVASGEYSNGTKSGWKPTPEMYKGRRDYRKRRIFTIDPTTAKDLDDALHIEELENGEIEIGVHIADVSHFVQPDSNIDIEARRRCTTVYLVDRTIPMLPRPLCEIACSLNENVERLAFSCVWRMNRDGNLVPGKNKVWYGRTVIQSCARLDYATAQNIIENKVGIGENEIDEELWPKSRRPTGCHTVDQVAADVRLMNEVAKARRSLRFRNGAIALNAVKLTFQLDGDRETPLLCKPYTIRDSNRLVEEYMLIANYLVAQRLITHSGGLACLRNHEAPLYTGLEKVAAISKEVLGFTFDISSSEAMQRSLNRLGRECQDELVLKCITEMLKLPMKAATYIAAGDFPDKAWAHFALNIPYYTHFTSPIRRYADVIVHRLLQATLDGEEAIQEFPFSQRDIGHFCERCNEKKEASRKAQDRSDVVFLALYLRRRPLKSQLGVVLSVGQKTFTVFVPELGISSLLYLDEHKDWIKFEPYEHLGKERRIKLERVAKHHDESWNQLVIKNFARVRVTCKCQDKPPINVKLAFEGPWVDSR